MCCRQRIRRLCCPCAGVCVLGPAFPFCLLRASGQRAVRDWAPQVFPGLLLLQPQSSVRAFPSSLLQELSGGCFGIPGRGLFNCGSESEEVNPCTVTGAFPGNLGCTSGGDRAVESSLSAGRRPRLPLCGLLSITAAAVVRFPGEAGWE